MFNKPLPRWEGQVTEPPEAKKTEGWIAGDRPPASWENWYRFTVYEAMEEMREVIESIELTWDEIQDKPTEFPPESHGNEAHTEDFETESGAQAKVDAHADLTNNPHNVTKSQVGLSNVTNDEQATKAEFNNHSERHEQGGADEIDLTGLPGESAELVAHKDKRATLTEKAHVETGIIPVTIATSWTGSEAPYSQVITATGVKSDDAATVDVNLDGAADFAEEQEILQDWSLVYRIKATADDEITVWATDETSVDIDVTIKVVR